MIVTGLSVGISGLSSYFDYATVKYSEAGAPLWTNRYNGPANNEDQATDVVVDGSGNVFVTGYSFTSDGTSDFLTIAYSSTGVPLWTNEDNARAVAVDSGGNVIVTGQSYRDFQTSDIVTVAYSTDGSLLDQSLQRPSQWRRCPADARPEWKRVGGRRFGRAFLGRENL